MSMLLTLLLLTFTMINAETIPYGHTGKCIYAFTDPFYPSFTLPPAQPYSPGDVQLNQNNSICFANGSNIAPGQGCNGRGFSYYDPILDQFLNTYIDSTGTNTSIADIIYATNQDHLNVRTIQSNQVNLASFLAEKILKIDLICNNGLLGCAYFTVDGNSSSTLPPSISGSIKTQSMMTVIGGTISWKPMNNTDTSSIIPVMFTQSYQWSAAQTACNQSRVYNLPSVPSDNDTFDCVSNATLCGGFLPLDTKGYCIDASISLDSRSTQISNVENITADSSFCVAFQSAYWGSIRSPLCNFSCNSVTSQWSIGSCVNLTMRSEGFINTPPVAAVISSIIVPINSSINITIPVFDADNDIVRCRWAKKTLILDECGDICGRIPGSTFYNNSCTLNFNSTDKTVGDYYAVALTIEDFSNTSTNTPLSSVPVQFLIEIVNASSCSLKPTISSNISNCTAIYVEDQFNFTLTISQGCPNTTITDFYTVAPLNMSRSNLTRNGTSNIWNITQTWIPTIEQLGLQVYCAVALDSNGIQSDQYCLIFNVVSLKQDLLCPGEVPETATNISVIGLVTAAPIPKMIDTAVVPNTSSTNFQFSSFDLALALGIGLPLLLIVGGLISWGLCCNKPKISSSKSSSQNDALKKINNSQTKSNQKPANDNKENKDLRSQLPDYRQQYVNDNPKPRKKISSVRHSLTLENSLKPKTYSDFDQNSITITKMTFFSPSTHSLPNKDVQFTPDHSPKRAKSTNHGSVLVRAYHDQENQKSALK